MHRNTVLLWSCRRPRLPGTHGHRLLIALWVVAQLFVFSANADDPRSVELFDFSWRFVKGDCAGAEAPAFDDRAWRTLDLPHDWSIEDLPMPAAPVAAARTISGPFDSDAPGAINTGFTTGGIGWYRKHFTLPQAWKDKVITVQFDGVYMAAEVWLNGHRLGDQPYGYTSFTFDLSPHLRFGDEENVLAVRVGNLGLNSRWYAGSGIYRHVWLTATAPVRIARWHPVITTPRVAADGATVRVLTQIDGATDQTAGLTLHVALLNAEGERVAGAESSANRGDNATLAFDQTLTVAQPRLWSPDFPHLYRAVCELRQQDRIVDRVEMPFGIRTIRFDPALGFFLNDRPLRIKGGCLHDNNGALGAAAFDRAEERKVGLLKAAGFNAVRSAHNPRSPAFLETCDRLGMMVLEEAFDQWGTAKLPDDYHLHFAEWWRRDLGAMIERDRNHPSIILWSIGSEIREAATEPGARLARELAEWVRALDSTRPVTANVNRMGKEWLAFDPFFAALDVGGYSYAKHVYESDHQRLPQRAILATETSQRDMFEYWMQVVDHAYVAGDFCWTAMDYMGEASNGWLGYGQAPAAVFPWNLAFCGDLDICGFRRPQSFYRAILWEPGNRLSAFVHRPVPSFAGANRSRWGWDDVATNWTWPGHKGQPLQVDVYSGCDEVRLLLNGADLGKKPVSLATRFIASWHVPYAPGTLTAIGYRAQQEVARSELRTVGQPAAVRLSADRPHIKADGQDLCYVTVEIVDTNGQRVPDAQRLVRFSIAGEGTLAAVGSAKPDSLESFRKPERTTFEGRCLAILRATRKPGRITVTATAESVGTTTIEIETMANRAFHASAHDLSP